MFDRSIRRLAASVLCGTVSLSQVGGFALAQDACCFEPAYRLQCETVVQKVPQTRYRLSTKTDYVEETQLSYRPVLKYRQEEREYRVAKPVTETRYVEETYSVLKPVTETSYRDEEVTRTRYVDETSEREESVTQYQPVTETKYYQKQYTVQRPVTETQMREQQYTVQRPVTETIMQTQQYTSMRPVTTVQNQVVDAGGYVAQQVVTPGQLQYGVGWQRNAYAVPGPLGIFSLNRGAPVLVPQVTPPTVQTQMAYRPNYVNQQVARTTYVPEVQQVQTPVQVQRMQTEVVRQQIPVQVQRMESEVVTENVPVQTTRMVPVQLTRKVPVTVRRPVTETLTRRVPVTSQRWVREEKVRKVPVQTTRMVYETKKEVVNVPYYEQEAVERKVMRPVTRQEYVPYTVMVDMPQTVVQRTPLSYIDPFSPAISQGYSSFSVPVSGSTIYESPIVTGSTVVQPSEVVESRSPAKEDDEDAEMTEDAQTELEGVRRNYSDDDNADADDLQELPQPQLNGDDVQLNPATEATTTGFRVTWSPMVDREA
ncbi:hypothetical protein [Crateriforma conspicua]|uniref:Uncharacterized protein n=1 Tax=Crateriforma conspicua TaxID=2527996 RepID=A0A5C6FUA7_9PLAN|nr:hypothetical protein [Crateriforma conspicua]TWU65854.1 hypothetical protein V7x_14080 [Crateriforma conspicua]